MLEDCVGSGDRAAAPAPATDDNDGQHEHFGVVTFVTPRDGLIVDMTELWTDINQAAPTGRRPK